MACRTISAHQRNRQGLDWDSGSAVGPSAIQTDKLAPYDWRFWWEFGTGESGNWGCHILDIPFWALDLKYPTNVSGSGPEPHPLKDTQVDEHHARLRGDEHSARGQVALVSRHTRDLGREGPEDGGGRSHKEHEQPLYRSKGMLLCGFGKYVLLPEANFKMTKAPTTFTKSPGFHQEWFDAIRGGKPATCNFDYTGPMAEAVFASQHRRIVSKEPSAGTPPHSRRLEIQAWTNTCAKSIARVGNVK